ncbi:hypothetical protein [Nitriliruptor alkaliphilus]|uniref:hypothetical protein n=1 Tax=Nitriliruptor alkaliphilus TaxID=427918 RepID=UPI001B80212C|nr:hypothetical protein [Nitriliruptor alkaliphilus]
MGSPVAEGATARWWPRFRRIDRIGLALVLGLAAWVWWASRVQDADGGPLVSLVLAVAIVATLARWAAFFHGTGAPALIVAGVVVYALVAGDDLVQGIGPGGSTEAAGALLATGTGAAAVVVLRARPIWARLAFGAMALLLAWLTWRSGSLAATAIAAVVLLSTIALLALPMQERRWVIVWPGLAAVVLLLGTVTYASLPLPDDLLFGGPGAERVEPWRAALDAVTESPRYGTGHLTDDPAVAVRTDAPGWARHDPLQFTAATGLVGGLLLLAVLWWSLAWVARPRGGPGSIVAGVVIAGSIAHACLEPIWHVPAVPLTLAALAGTASMRGGDASWRLDALGVRFLRWVHRGDRLEPRGEPQGEPQVEVEPRDLPDAQREPTARD